MSEYFVRHLNDRVELWLIKTSHTFFEQEEDLLDDSNFIESFSLDFSADGLIGQDWDLIYTGRCHFFRTTPYFFYTTGRERARQ